MNKSNYPFSEINLWLNKKDSFHIFLPSQPNLDQVASACALTSSLNRSGKKAQVITREPIKTAFSQVYGVDKIRQKIRGRSFVVDIKYPFTNVEKINWDDQVEDRVRLIIQTQPGARPIEENMVELSRRGGAAQNIISIGFASRQQLGDTVASASENATKTDWEVINIARQEGELFGAVNLVDREALSYAEIIAALIEGLSLPANRDEASNLLLGLQAATDSFAPSAVSADAFEAAAFCLRAGGRLQQNKPEKEKNFQKPKIYRGTSE